MFSFKKNKKSKKRGNDENLMTVNLNYHFPVRKILPIAVDPRQLRS